MTSTSRSPSLPRCSAPPRSPTARCFSRRSPRDPTSVRTIPCSRAGPVGDLRRGLPGTVPERVGPDRQRIHRGHDRGPEQSHAHAEHIGQRVFRGHRDRADYSGLRSLLPHRAGRLLDVAAYLRGQQAPDVPTDLSVVIAAASVPEPSSLTLGGVAALIVWESPCVIEAASDPRADCPWIDHDCTRSEPAGAVRNWRRWGDRARMMTSKRRKRLRMPRRCRLSGHDVASAIDSPTRSNKPGSRP